MAYENLMISGCSGVIQTARPPSLEGRLEFLQRCVGRLSDVRRRIEKITADVSIQPKEDSSETAQHPCCDLSSRFGESISYLHANIEQIERLVTSLDSALFEPKPVSTQEKRA